MPKSDRLLAAFAHMLPMKSEFHKILIWKFETQIGE